MEKELKLTDGSIIVRPYRRSDINDLYAAARESIAEVSIWMPWCHGGYSVEESREWVESQAQAWQEGTEYGFVITDSASGFFLGGCGLNHIGPVNRMANLGYWVRTSRTGHGVATTATLLLAQFGFRELQLNRIEILAAASNEASQRVAEKAGATREGVLQHSELLGGTVLNRLLEIIRLLRMAGLGILARFFA